ncbi:RagB/SusD family nutrient uptake outer membrane protein [Labilibacter sediminis]|nr:RagB/SusD family nutrient uptake outer membrane protein [Labilibacter sediminis]
MEKYLYIGLLFVALGFVSCEDFLDREPISEVTDQNFYQTEEELQEALAACYDVMQWQDQWANNPYEDWMIGDICSDDAVKGGQSERAFQDEMIEMTNFTIKSSNIHLEILWKNSYLGIFRCNIFLEKIADFEMNQDEKDMYIAEARFIRAYFYFKLNTVWGGVPYINKVMSPEDALVARSGTSEIYKHIKDDLEFAADKLMKKSEVDQGRITKGAALGLLTKVYCFQEDWPNAKLTAEQLFALGEYELDPDYARVFSMDGEFGSGSIFEINFLTTDDINMEPGFWYVGTEGSAIPYWQSPTDDKGKAYCQVSEDLIQEFETNDPRKEVTVSEQYEVGYGTGYFNQKVIYSDANPYPAGSLNPPQMSGVNKRVIRLADIYLLYAEACYHEGAEGLTREYLNKIRIRASGDTNPQVLPNIHQSVTGQALLDAVYHERRVELGLESHRFFDLVRWGQAAAKLPGFTQGINEVWPIPFEEVQKTNGVVVQNNGYN